MTSTIAPPPVATGANELRMPSLGADMDHGTLIRWSIAPGATVKRGQVVGEVETEKGVFELESTSAGVVAELLVAPGTRVRVGTPLARLGGAGATEPLGPSSAQPAAATWPTSVAAPSPAPAAAETKATPTTPAAPAVLPPTPVAIAPPLAPAAPFGAPAIGAPAIGAPAIGAPAVGAPAVGAPAIGAPAVGAPLVGAPAIGAPVAAPGRTRASPAARRLAGEHGLDLASIVGSGPHGVVRLSDVEAALAAPAAGAPPTAALPPTPDAGSAHDAMRRAVAAAVSRSKREIPHYYIAADLELSKPLAWLAAQNAARPLAERVLPAALLLRAVAVALRSYPELNGFWIDGAVRPSAAIHLGVAISLRGGGLIAPAIHDADRLTTIDLMRALGDLVARARRGGLRTSEMTDATVTVSNLGDEGAASLFGVIYPPQVALVGFGAIAERPWAEHGMVGARPVVTMTLAGDHRATDGHYGSRFMREVARLLQSPEAL